MKTIKRILIAACLFFAAGCAKETAPGSEAGFGMLDLGSITQSIVTTRAGETDDYKIEVWSVRTSELVINKTLSECTGSVPLLVGRYRMVVSSSELVPAAWDTPWYSTRRTFDILKNETTNLNDVVCTLGNVKVTVAYGQSLLAVLDEKESLGATVSVGEASLSYPYGWTQSGYFAVDGENTRMTVSFSGVINNALVTYSDDIFVSPGEWERVRFVLEGDDTFRMEVYDNEIGGIDDGDNWGAF